MKKCARCGELKAIEEFHLKRGMQRQPYCVGCNKQYKAEWYETNRARHYERVRKRIDELRKFVADIKDSPCTDCGNVFHPAAMDFDHLADKTMNIGKMVTEGYSRKSILEEIAKCELVCSNCHRVRTWERNQAALV